MRKMILGNVSRVDFWLVILLLAACVGSTSTPLPTVEVALGIFSGRPDPAWMLSPEQTEALLAKLDALPSGIAHEEAGGLGYHGFYVRMFQGDGRREKRVTVFDGAVHVEAGGGGIWKADPDRALEKWLLELASSQVDAALVTEVRKSLALTAEPSMTPMPQATSTPVLALTPVPALDLQDAEIAYLDTESHLWVTDAAGTAFRQLTDEGAVASPAWSPDGTLLACVRYDDAQTLAQGRVWLYDMRTSLASAIGPELERLTGIAWSPDGHYLLLHVGTGMVGTLSILELSSGKIVEDFGSIGGGVWSPRSDAVAIGLRRPLTKSLSLETGDSVSLAVQAIGRLEPIVLLEGDAETLYFPRTWLPDARILYDRLDWDEAGGSGVYSQWTLVFDEEHLDAEPQLATDLPLPYQPEIVARVQARLSPTLSGAIVWSPDYRHLVVAAGDAGKHELYRIDWTTATSYRLVSGVSPAWRPSSPSIPSTPAVDTPASTPIPPESAHWLGKLAYVQQGDLWIKDVPAGRPQPLTDDAAGGGGNFAPRWSPSGTWLAFRKTDTPPGGWQRRAEGEVWLARVDGQVVYALPATGEVEATAWSPQRDRLAYVDDAGLHVIDADGAAVLTLVATASASERIGTIAWSPDGVWLAYDVARDGYQGLWKIPVAGGDAVELYDSGFPEKGRALLADWTRDGRFVLFWQGDIDSASLLAGGAPLCVLPGAGGAPVPLVTPLKAAAVLFYSQSVAVAPPGSDPARVALSLGGGRETLFNKQVGIATIGDGDFDALSLRGQSAIALSWSPDGERLAYTAVNLEAITNGDSTHGQLMQRRIYTVDMGGHVRPLTHDPAYRDEYPQWSTDGAYILFPRLNEDDAASLWLVPASGGEPYPVADTLSPLAEGFWAGYYGYVEWGHLFDWWRPAPGPVAEGAPTAASDPAAWDIVTDTLVSPDGVWLAQQTTAYPRSGRGDRLHRLLTVSRIDGERAWTLVDAWEEGALGAATLRPLQWARDSRALYLSHVTTPDGCPGLVNGSGLLRFDVDDGAVTELMPSQGRTWLRLSPDDRTLAYGALTLRDLATGEERHVPLDVAEDATSGHIVWSPDGRAVALTIVEGYCGSPESRVHTIVYVDTSVLATTIPLVDETHGFVTVAWSEGNNRHYWK